MQEKNVPKSQQVTDIILKLACELPIKDVCAPIIDADDTDDPQEHVVFAQLREPKTGWTLAHNEKRSYEELPDGGKTLYEAILRAWVKTQLYPERYEIDDEDKATRDDKPRESSADDRPRRRIRDED